jgi:hypothetical protein
MKNSPVLSSLANFSLPDGHKDQASRDEKGAFMQGRDLHGILKQAGATHLYHANSVVTSCTFLQQGGLLSRGSIEDRGLKQSQQVSDELDKKYDLWRRIFLPHADIHDRTGQEKGPNPYGPALFALALDVLLQLPAGTEIRVTRKSPAYWYDNEPESGRWFQSAEELAQNIAPGDLDKMLSIQTPSGKLSFPGQQARIILDDPQRQLPSGKDAYAHAASQLQAAAAAGHIEVSIERRKCRNGCICGEKYANWSAPVTDFYFG